MVNPEDHEKTSFTRHFNVFAYKRMPLNDATPQELSKDVCMKSYQIRLKKI